MTTSNVAFFGCCFIIFIQLTSGINIKSSNNMSMVIVPSGTVDAQRGDFLIFSCVVLVSPRPPVRWYDSKGVHLKLQQEGEYLKLPDITKEDNYTCVAQNSMGQVNKTVHVRVWSSVNEISDTSVVQLRIVRTEADAVVLGFKSASWNTPHCNISYQSQEALFYHHVRINKIVNYGLFHDEEQTIVINDLQANTAYELKVTCKSIVSVTDDSYSGYLHRYLHFVTAAESANVSTHSFNSTTELTTSTTELTTINIPASKHALSSALSPGRDVTLVLLSALTMLILIVIVIIGISFYLKIKSKKQFPLIKYDKTQEIIEMD